MPNGRVCITLEENKRRNERYQSEEDEKELNDVSVGHWVEAAKEGVENGNQGR